MSRLFRSAATGSLQFPSLELEDEPWQWPMPRSSWRHEPLPANDVAQACRIETRNGTLAEGEMLDIDPRAGRLVFRPQGGTSAGTVDFARVRRLTLLTPVSPARRAPGAPVERIPAAAQERKYRLTMSDDAAPMTGRTAGHVETEHALYLFDPVDEHRALQRVLVPRSAYTACEFGPSVEEVAARRWIATPQELVAAVEGQARAPVLRIGEALLNLGLVLPEQIDRALAAQRGDVPLGEMLVASGVITRANLHTALAHKMGYPLVDLTRFPVDPAAARLLPLRLAAECFALPLMTHGESLIVAVDRPSRTTKLHNLRALAQLKLVPVLASKGQIMSTLGGLAQRDVWKHNVFAQLVFPPTTV